MSIGSLLDRIAACFLDESQNKENDEQINAALEAATLEAMVEPEKETPAIAVADERALEFGDTATAYTLNLPSYENFNKAYAFDYAIEGVEQNEKSTTATYTTETTDAGMYEAAMDVVETAREANQHGKAVASYEQALETRETATVFKMLNPIKWKLMYDNTQLQMIF